jgi:rod shape-determining protein MreD
MRRLFFGLLTLFIGMLFQLVCSRYLSIYGASPQVLLLFVVAIGFIYGPMMGETLGFFWGLMSDSMGVSMFGMQALLLTLAGYISGSLRRRVASERLSAQMVIAVIATFFYNVGASTLYQMFEEGGGRNSIFSFTVEAVINALFVAAVFSLTERWIYIWKLNHEYV